MPKRKTEPGGYEPQADEPREPLVDARLDIRSEEGCIDALDLYFEGFRQQQVSGEHLDTVCRVTNTMATLLEKKRKRDPKVGEPAAKPRTTMAPSPFGVVQGGRDDAMQPGVTCALGRK